MAFIILHVSILISLVHIFFDFFLDFIDVTADWDILFRQLDLLKDNTLASPSSYPASVFPNVNK